MNDERRHGIDEFTEKLSEVETDVAVIKSKMSGQAGMRRLLWTMAAALFVQIIAGAVGYGEIKSQLEHLDLSNLEKDVATALTVIGDHGTELNTVREEQFRVRGLMDNMRLQFAEELTNRTKDRFYRSDWEAGRMWINEKFRNQELRLDHIEQGQHGAHVPMKKFEE